MIKVEYIKLLISFEVVFTTNDDSRHRVAVFGSFLQEKYLTSLKTYIYLIQPAAKGVCVLY